jgi:hypothetical protein
VKMRVTRTRRARHDSMRVLHFLSFFPTSQIENNSSPI